MNDAHLENPAFAATVRQEAPEAINTRSLQMLIDRYRDEGGGRTVVGALPVDVTFPVLRPELFMASELTAESSAVAPSGEQEVPLSATSWLCLSRAARTAM